MVKNKVLGVSVAVEQVDDPLLLLRGEQLVTVVVAVISAVPAEVSLYFRAQGSIILALHIPENGVEAIGGMYLADGFETLASIPLEGCREHRIAPLPVVRNIFGRKVPHALVRLRATVEEAENPRWRKQVVRKVRILLHR